MGLLLSYAVSDVYDSFHIACSWQSNVKGCGLTEVVRAGVWEPCLCIRVSCDILTVRGQLS